MYAALVWLYSTIGAVHFTDELGELLVLLLLLVLLQQQLLLLWYSTFETSCSLVSPAVLQSRR